MIHLSTTLQQSVLHLQFNRPEKKNALTVEMYQALTDALEQAQSNDEVHVVLLKGHPECFTSGNDLHSFITPDPKNTRVVETFLHTFANFPKPIIAVVSGLAIGIGTTLLLHCDMVLAADNATFCLPFINLGLCPEFAVSLLLPKLMGYAKAAEHLMLGTPFTAQEAHQWGLINHVVPLDQLEQTATHYSLALSQQPRQALMHTKALLKAPLLAKIHTQIQEELTLFVACLESSEAQKRINHLLNKAR